MNSFSAAMPYSFSQSAHGGDTRRVVGLSPRLSLRRAKTACPEPTAANSLDL
jgi:hypothetical protein